MTERSETATTTARKELSLSRVFSAPRAKVFAAWGSADHIKQWFCPADCSVPDARVELRAGGAFDVCMRGPTGQDHWMRGHFVDVQPDERLEFVSDVTGGDGATAFTAHTIVTFADDAGGTKLDVVQIYDIRDPSAADMISGARQGWTQTLDRLERLIASMESEPASRSVVHSMFRVERRYDAAPARVWAALTDPQAKAKWFGGPNGDFELLERSMDVRPGGREALEGRWKNGTVSRFDAVYHDVVDRRRLVYSYEMRLNGRKISVSLASLELSEQSAGARLVVTEQGAFLDGYDDAGSREHGTGFLLDALGASLKS